MRLSAVADLSGGGGSWEEGKERFDCVGKVFRIFV